MSLRDIQRMLREDELNQKTYQSKPTNIMCKYSTSEIEKLLIEAIHEGIRFGRELETHKDKDSPTPSAIHVAVKWRVKEILNKDKDE